MVTTSAVEKLAPELLRGLTILGPPETPGPDLALELGLSAWMLGGRTDLVGIGRALSDVRAAVIEAAGIDPRLEPVPLVGRASRDDALRAATYLGELVERAARVAGCPPGVLVERTVERLSESAVSYAVDKDVDGGHDDAPLAKIIPIR